MKGGLPDEKASILKSMKTQLVPSSLPSSLSFALFLLLGFDIWVQPEIGEEKSQDSFTRI